MSWWCKPVGASKYTWFSPLQYTNIDIDALPGNINQTSDLNCEAEAACIPGTPVFASSRPYR